MKFHIWCIITGRMVIPLLWFLCSSLVGSFANMVTYSTIKIAASYASFGIVIIGHIFFILLIIEAYKTKVLPVQTKSTDLLNEFAE